MEPSLSVYLTPRPCWVYFKISPGSDSCVPSILVQAVFLFHLSIVIDRLIFLLLVPHNHSLWLGGSIQLDPVIALYKAPQTSSVFFIVGPLWPLGPRDLSSYHPFCAVCVHVPLSAQFAPTLGYLVSLMSFSGPCSFSSPKIFHLLSVYPVSH